MSCPSKIAGCSAGSRATQDRKSTRLNSSHTVISYAVFCLKKNKYKRPSQQRIQNEWSRVLEISTMKPRTGPANHRIMNATLHAHAHGLVIGIDGLKIAAE